MSQVDDSRVAHSDKGKNSKKVTTPGVVMNGVGRVVVVGLRWYQAVISPMINRGQTNCIYDIPCSEYAVEQFETVNPILATGRSIWRVLSCNPVNGWRRNRAR